MTSRFLGKTMMKSSRIQIPQIRQSKVLYKGIECVCKSRDGSIEQLRRILWDSNIWADKQSGEKTLYTYLMEECSGKKEQSVQKLNWEHAPLIPGTAWRPMWLEVDGQGGKVLAMRVVGLGGTWSCRSFGFGRHWKVLFREWHNLIYSLQWTLWFRCGKM